MQLLQMKLCRKWPRELVREIFGFVGKWCTKCYRLPANGGGPRYRTRVSRGIGSGWLNPRHLHMSPDMAKKWELLGPVIVHVQPHRTGIFVNNNVQAAMIQWGGRVLRWMDVDLEDYESRPLRHDAETMLRLLKRAQWELENMGELLQMWAPPNSGPYMYWYSRKIDVQLLLDKCIHIMFDTAEMPRFNDLEDLVDIWGPLIHAYACSWNEDCIFPPCLEPDLRPSDATIQLIRSQVGRWSMRTFMNVRD